MSDQSLHNGIIVGIITAVFGWFVRIVGKRVYSDFVDRLTKLEEKVIKMNVATKTEIFELKKDQAGNVTREELARCQERLYDALEARFNKLEELIRYNQKRVDHIIDNAPPKREN